MSYRDDRQRVFELMQQAGAIIRHQETQDVQHMLWAAATDDLADAVTKPADLGPYDPETLLQAFSTASREFWLREGEGSRRAPRLRLVTDDEFEQMAYPHGRGVA